MTQVLTTEDGSEGEKGSAGDMALFVRAHDTPNVDYLTFHLWPSNWSWIDHKDPAARLDSGLATSLDYIDRHIEVAGKLGKPIVLSEFGLNRDQGAYDPASGTQQWLLRGSVLSAVEQTLSQLDVLEDVRRDREERRRRPTFAAVLSEADLRPRPFAGTD